MATQQVASPRLPIDPVDTRLSKQLLKRTHCVSQAMASCVAADALESLAFKLPNLNLMKNHFACVISSEVECYVHTSDDGSQRLF
jgi:hypothetical protein